MRFAKERPGNVAPLDITKMCRICQVGDRVHVDRRRLREGIRWEYIQVVIGYHFLLASAELLSDVGTSTIAGFLPRTVSCYTARGVLVQRTLTGNGSTCRLTPFAIAAFQRGVSQRFAQPFLP